MSAQLLVAVSVEIAVVVALAILLDASVDHRKDVIPGGSAFEDLDWALRALNPENYKPSGRFIYRTIVTLMLLSIIGVLAIVFYA